MKQIINILFAFLKFILLLLATGLIFYGLLVTFSRLDKPVTEAIPTLLPFILLLIAFVINLLAKQRQINRNLFYNIVCVLVLSAVIFIGYRAKFDTGMVLYQKYGINYNPSYLADNLGTIKLMIYLLFASNVLLMFTKKPKNQKTENVEKIKTVTE